MKRYYYILLSLLLLSCSSPKKGEATFNIEEHRDKFKHERFNKLDLDSIPFDFQQEPLDSTEYVSIFQAPFNRAVYEGSPCYPYSIQSEMPNYSSISLLQYNEAESIEMILVNHSVDGQLIDIKTIAISGADGNSSMNMNTRYLDESTMESNYVKRDVTDSGGQSETEFIFRKKERIEIDKEGKFKILSLDTITETLEKSYLGISSYYYPSKEYFQNNSNLVQVELNTYASYPDLIQALDSVTCADRTPVIIYQNKSSRFHLIPDHPCPDRAIVYDFKERNRVRITKDSIHTWFSRTDLDDLSKVVKRHVLNNGTDVQYSESPEKAFFSIQQDSIINIQELERTLILLSEAFNELNHQHGKSLSLNTMIGEKPLIPVQEPPAEKN